MRLPSFRRIAGRSFRRHRFLSAAIIAGGICLTLAGANRSSAQNPTPSAAAPTGNLFATDGGFEKIAATEEVLWDGVNSSGILAVPPFSASVVTERSAYAPLAMPCSVAMADLNGDGKADLLVASPNGYYFYYPNSGTATEPVFTNAEILPLYLSTSYKRREKYYERDHLDFVRYCPRIALADWRGRGVLDIMMGNYMGELYLIPNDGAGSHASFRQPPSLDSVRIPTDDRGRLWGNVLSPVGCDWDGKGRLDLLLGEGTYSANSVRLLENVGGGNPKFSSTKTSYLAYGDGREQLIPAVVDYNGDGKPDLLVSDRTREIGVYLNTGGKNTESLARTSTISFGGSIKTPAFAAPCITDFNGDGLFDIVMGLDNGHIGVALNKGTKGQPEFGPVQELKGTDRIGRTFKRPNGWTFSPHSEYGNAMSYFSVVSAADDAASAPPEGANCMKAGYYPLANTIFPFPNDGVPGMYRKFSLWRTRVTLNIGKNYTLTFKVKNLGMEKLHYDFHSLYDDYVGAVKQETDDRNRSRRVGERVVEYVNVGDNFNGGGNWSTVTKTLNVRYKKPELNSLTTMTGAIEITFWSKSMTDAVYFDDFQLVQAKE